MSIKLVIDDLMIPSRQSGAVYLPVQNHCCFVRPSISAHYLTDGHCCSFAKRTPLFSPPVLLSLPHIRTCIVNRNGGGILDKHLSPHFFLSLSFSFFAPQLSSRHLTFLRERQRSSRTLHFLTLHPRFCRLSYYVLVKYLWRGLLMLAAFLEIPHYSTAG